jgi:branched-chain amino acid transport system substrate-binding protein
MLNLALMYDLKKVAIVYADDEFSMEMAKGAKKWAPILDLDIVVFEKFKKGTKNLIPLAQKAMDAKVELLMVGGHFNESVNMRRALKNIDWYPKAYYATVGPALEKYQEIL